LLESVFGLHIGDDLGTLMVEIIVSRPGLYARRVGRTEHPTVKTVYEILKDLNRFRVRYLLIHYQV